MSFVDMSEVEWKAEDLLTIKPTGDYERWELELFRRRYVKQKKEVAEADAAWKEASKGGTFTREEAAAHEKAFREADVRRSNAHAHMSTIVRSAEGDLAFAKTTDEWVAKERTEACKEMYNPRKFCEYSVMYSALPGSPEETRNKALLEAEKEYKLALEDARSDACSFYRGDFERGRSSYLRSQKAEIEEEFEERKAAIEEKFYTDYLSRFS
jgi:hypothetical protein